MKNTIVFSEIPSKEDFESSFFLLKDKGMKQRIYLDIDSIVYSIEKKNELYIVSFNLVTKHFSNYETIVEILKKKFQQDLIFYKRNRKELNGRIHILKNILKV